MRELRTLALGSAVLIGGGLGLPAALAGPVTTTIPDPLHGYCAGCADFNMGGNTVTANTTSGFTNPWGFWDSNGPATADFRIDFAVPNNKQTGITSIAITGTQGGPTNTSPISVSANAIAGEWTTGDLDAFLAGNLPGGGSPTNPIDNFLPFTKQFDSAAMGYSLYQADLGNTRLAGMDNTTSGPQLSTDLSKLPLGTMIFGFFEVPSGNASWTATASSGVLYQNGSPPGTQQSAPPVPEPGSLVLLGTALAGLGFFGVRRRRQS